MNNIDKILEKLPGIQQEMKDIPKKRLTEFVHYAFMSEFTPGVSKLEVALGSAVYGYVLGQRDSIDLEGLE